MQNIWSGFVNIFLLIKRMQELFETELHLWIIVTYYSFWEVVKQTV